jgi:hypothetical protein
MNQGGAPGKKKRRRRLMQDVAAPQGNRKYMCVSGVPSSLHAKVSNHIMSKGGAAGLREVHHEVRAWFCRIPTCCTALCDLKYHRLRLLFLVGILHLVTNRDLYDARNRNMFAKHLRAVDAASHELRNRAVSMWSSLWPKPEDRQLARVPRNEAARSLVGSARLVSVQHPLETLVTSHVRSKHSPLARLDH